MLAQPDTAVPEEVITAKIQNKLRDSFKPSNNWVSDGSEEFLPRNSLLEALSGKNIKSLLHQRAETKEINLDAIMSGEKRIKIFAILILIDEYVKRQRFIEQDVWDSELPMNRNRVMSCSGLGGNSVDSFMWYQRVVDVPTWRFSLRDIRKEEYHWHRVLPFQEKTMLSRGGQGVVWKVKIHRDHFDSFTQVVSCIISDCIEAICTNSCTEEETAVSSRRLQFCDERVP